jgi:hypothetical protein
VMPGFTRAWVHFGRASMNYHGTWHPGLAPCLPSYRKASPFASTDKLSQDVLATWRRPRIAAWPRFGLAPGRSRGRADGLKGAWISPSTHRTGHERGRPPAGGGCALLGRARSHACWAAEPSSSLRPPAPIPPEPQLASRRELGGAGSGSRVRIAMPAQSEMALRSMPARLRRPV